MPSRENKNSWFGCYGVDINRNWGFHWGEGGASTDTCSETYRGTPLFPPLWVIIAVGQ
jgi:carboxypeptidase T